MPLPLPTKQNALVPKLAGDVTPKTPGAPGQPRVPAPLGTPAVPAAPTGMIPTPPPIGVPEGPTAVPAPRQPQGETFAPPTGLPAPNQPVAPPDVSPTLTPTDPNDPLTGKTIAPGRGLDHFALADERFDTFAKGTDPAYQAALRDAKRVGAAAGGLGSGMLRTSLGNELNLRNTQLDTEKRGLFSDALEDTVGDARFATGIAQDQQRFQSGQQQQLFENELRRMGFDDDLLNSAFGRALMQWQAGNTGGTGSGTILSGAGQAGDTGRDAMSALDAWIAARNRIPGAGGGPVPTGQPVLRPPVTLPPGSA